MRIYIGITGLSGTGKDTVADILTNLAEAYGIQIYRHSHSDKIRDELTLRGRVGDSASRATLIELGNELRETQGYGVLAKRIIVATERETRQTEDGRLSLIIVTGIRNPEEVRTYRRAWGTRFILVVVEASEKVRSMRIATRGQYQEDVSLSAEVEQADRAIGILTCGQMSDYCIRNESTLEKLEAEVRDFFAANIAPAIGVRDAIL